MKFWLFALLSPFLFAVEENNSGTLSHESEASVVLASGNADTETYSLKETTSYSWQGNTLKNTGSYLMGKTSGVESAKKWDLGLRYDRVLSGALSAFTGYQIDGNIFAGTELRHTVDIGGKYDIWKTGTEAWHAELGYRLTAEDFTNQTQLTSHFSRVYSEWSRQWTEAVSTKLWAEYLQSFNLSDDYRINFEPSLSVVLTKVFSLKLAYLFNYRNVPAIAGKKQTDTLFTSALVAKF